MSKQSEDVMAMKSQRVDEDPKRKILLGAYEDKHQVAGKWDQRLKVRKRRHDRQKNPRPEQNQTKPTPSRKVETLTNGRSSRDVSELYF
jgi:hypothetical protein